MPPPECRLSLPAAMKRPGAELGSVAHEWQVEGEHVAARGRLAHHQMDLPVHWARQPHLYNARIPRCARHHIMMIGALYLVAPVDRKSKIKTTGESLPGAHFTLAKATSPGGKAGWLFGGEGVRAPCLCAASACAVHVVAAACVPARVYVAVVGQALPHPWQQVLRLCAAPTAGAFIRRSARSRVGTHVWARRQHCGGVGGISAQADGKNVRRSLRTRR
jgi:hypothetical protein